MKASNRTAIYAGTFDPITNGHMDIIERASEMFDGVIIAIGTNAKKKDSHMFKLFKRMDMIVTATSHLENITVATFEGLLVDYAAKMEVGVIIRGLRTVSDFEYEFQMVKTNRRLNPNIESVFLMPKPETEFISSSVVKEIWLNDGKIDQFVPKNVADDFGLMKHGGYN
jgi:pantetheine-phosphate adenylyltransferase